MSVEREKDCTQTLQLHPYFSLIVNENQSEMRQGVWFDNSTVVKNCNCLIWILKRPQ